MAGVSPLSGTGVDSVGCSSQVGARARRLRTQAESGCWAWGVQKKCPIYLPGAQMAGYLLGVHILLLLMVLSSFIPIYCLLSFSLEL